MSRVIPFVLVLVAACSKADEALKSLEGVRAAACGCKATDLACVQAGVAKVEKWHADYAAVEGARSQAAKATAALEAIEGCQTSQILDAIPERAGCAKLDGDAKAAARWCRVAGWGDAKAVEAKELPFGATLQGEHQAATVGAEPEAPITTTLAIGGTPEAPTAGGAAITAKGKGWTWKDGESSVELRKVEGGWVALTIDGERRGVTVLDAP